MAEQVAATQRAYTLRLRGVDPQGPSWREALWRTHEAVNKGAKAFGDWLLTLRGGLDHALADAKVKDGKSERCPTDDERKGRRILLALSWLSVESEKGAPAEHFVPHDLDKQSGTRSRWKTVDALKEILKGRGLCESEIELWVQDCSASLSATIRDDAVWVNRSKAFDTICNGQKIVEARKDCQTMLWYLLGDDYLTLPKKPEKPKEEPTETEGEPSEEESNQERRSAVIQSGKGAGQRTRHPFSHIFGDSTGFGKPLRKLDLRDHWKTHLETRVTASQIPMRDAKKKKEEGVSQKEGVSPEEGVSPTELHREMFSKAASRLAQIWTKQKQQEVERQNRKAADEALKTLEADTQCKSALDLLDALCVERGTASGAQEEYRIRPRQIDGWDRVVKAWDPTANTCDPTVAEEQRIAAAKRLQDEDSDEKFGDINLFIALAEDKYKAVWWHANAPKPEILKTYVKGKKARADAVRLKVAAFRHPDPYFNPVFCQFGVSRPRIEFRRLRDFTSKPEGRDVRAVGLLLWNGEKADLHVLHAVSKRMDREVGDACGSVQKGAADLAEVTRRSRLSIATLAQLPEKGSVRVAHVFDRKKVKARKTNEKGAGAEGASEPAREKEPEWNGTLLGERRALEAIGRLVEDGKHTEAKECRRRLHWWLIVSLEMRPQGPWLKYGEDNNLLEVRYDKQQKENVVATAPRNSRDEWRGLAYPFRHPCNEKGRKGMARHQLSRLSGLRVLSVDLGHRYAAACAVWETLTTGCFQTEIEGRRILRGGTGEDALYCHTEHEANGRTHTTIYRRIGPDKWPDRTPHPAPWARLDRQFLIKLQGEEDSAREASNDEIWAMHRMETALGRAVPLIDRLVAAGWGHTEKQKARLEGLKTLGWTPAPRAQQSADPEGTQEEGYRPSLCVDELMFSAVRTLRLGLRRHGDRARIAHYLITDEKIKPGGVKERLDENGRVELLLDALVLWHNLFSSRSWQDAAAKQLWDAHVAKMSGYQRPEEIREGISRQERKKKQEEIRHNLRCAAAALAKDANLRKALHDAWNERWKHDDEQWKKHLRWFKAWVLPHGPAANSCSIRKAGGLSLTRIATLTEFRRKVQVGFFTRLHPDGTKAQINEQFGQSTLDAIEHLREQRVKQLASRIAEAALGIGRMKRSEGGKDPRRPRARVDRPCHAVVIENLTRYRPEETRTRRENRQLMSWSSSKVKKYLAEACQLNGLHLREVQAGYTSRQDSRTGAPGIRCQDVPVKEFMQSPFWRRQVAQAEKRQAEGKGDARECFLCELNAKWKGKPEADWEKAGAVRIPLKGGEIFVSADPKSPAAKGLQADLNAAANIGLKALLDPDWAGRWWYVPCDPTSFKPVEDKVGGCAAICLDKPLKNASAAQDTDKPGKKRRKAGKQTGACVNLWRDVCSQPISAGDGWREFTPYWNGVQARVVNILRQAAGFARDPEER